MNISLPDPLRDLIRKNQLRTEKLKTLQEAITKGFNSGDAGELDMKAIKLKARQKEGLKT